MPFTPDKGGRGVIDPEWGGVPPILILAGNYDSLTLVLHEAEELSMKARGGTPSLS
jgi:hypothetical protein